MTHKIIITIYSQENKARLTDNCKLLSEYKFDDQKELKETSFLLKIDAFDYACSLSTPCEFSMKHF